MIAPAQVLGLTWKAVSVFVTVALATGAAAYEYGRRTEAADTREETVSENSKQLKELSTSVQALSDAVAAMTESFIQARDELEHNRRDILHQSRIIHDQFIDPGGTCGNPDCIFCNPKEASARGIDIDVPDFDGGYDPKADGGSPDTDGRLGDRSRWEAEGDG